jgi:putative CocE/NonD family hydrolase
MKTRMLRVLAFLLLPSLFLTSQTRFDVKAHYTKYEYRIPMRDGVKLFTSVYVPKDTSQPYPIMLNRTPYSVAPYGPDNYRSMVGPSEHFAREKFIFAYQDVRGKFMSEGTFEFMRPYKPVKASNMDTDESSDTYDTIDWLVKNIPRNNGKVGVWGISYPGFQAAMSALDAHPALVAVSPQAPMADVFIGDDFHHNGAFFLIHAFRWLAGTAPARSNQRAAMDGPPQAPDFGTPDGYEFFLNLGPLANVNRVWFKDQVPIWNEFMQHGTYDQYWRSRNIIPHFTNVKPAVMTVVGWFDSEDKYGGVHLYQKIERENPNTHNIIVWGPWLHGGWARMDGDTLGHIRFGSKTGVWYREQVELPFFLYYLKGKGTLKLPEVTAFMTGANEWKSYSAWPPSEATPKTLYLHANGKLSFTAPSERTTTYDEYISDPKKPVPFTAQTTMAMGHTFMVEDQRFAWSRPDVLVYQTEPLTEELTIAGPTKVVLYGSTSGTDCDWIVKLIDVYPGDAPDPNPNPTGVRMGGFQMLLAGEVFRAKFRKSFEKPEPLQPGQVTRFEFDLPDKLHRFNKGHKIMVQIQSSWFPLVDLNPGKFVDIYNAKESDFQKTTQRVYRSGRWSTHLEFKTVRD